MTPETTISEKTIYDGSMLTFSVREATLEDGTRVNREIVSTKGAVVIVALTAENDVRLVRQFRAAAQKWIIELPAGTLNRGEDPAIAAPRELAEETGDTAAHWEYLGGFYTAPGILTEFLHLYLATDLTAGDTHFDFDEHIENITVPWVEAMAMIKRGDIADAKTIAGLTRAGLHNNLPF